MDEVELAQTKTVIVGLGKTGFACARFLYERGCPVAVTDSRVEPPMLAMAREHLPDLPLFLGEFNQHALNQAQQIVISPGVPLTEPAVANAIARGVPVIGEIELFARHARAPVLGVTGSNGKSTVTTLLGYLCREAGLDVAVGGNLGEPAIALIRDPEPAAYILELSSFQLEMVQSLAVLAGVVLNISEDHLDRHAGMANYCAAKFRVFNRAGYVIQNLDEPATIGPLETLAPETRRITFSLTREDADFTLRQYAGEAWLFGQQRALMPVREIPLKGYHNIANVLAALAMASTLEIAPERVLNAVRQFDGLAHRMQWTATHQGVIWYNDSKGTNVGATIAAVNGLASPVILIAGGEGKGADFSVLGEAFAGKVKHVVLIGRDGPLIGAALAGKIPASSARSMREAVQQAAALAQAGDIVLLSPACASFDMFANYEQRGEIFMQCVREITG